ncbi:hypothetical protein [Sinorhizobium meliloti]|uniref:hypothetical protein n=1 Tax=Rhizobium meliloti TaxID=382 RepID=UPI00067F2867|nr:hypothetical protein [Sinorhizobium meliloti]
MAEPDRFAWQILRRHFNTDDLTALESSRRQFTARLLPDLQSLVEELVAPLSPELLGLYQQWETNPLKLSDLTGSEGPFVVRLTPVQRQDIDVGEDEPYASLNNGLWLIKIGDDKPAAIMLSKFLARFYAKDPGRNRSYA